MSYQVVKGAQDILPVEVKKWQKLEEIIKKYCEIYRYEEIRTPIFEETKVFKRENDSSDMVNKEMYSFQAGSDNLTLRPEGTAGVIRAFNQYKMHGNADLPIKLFYIGEMFRYERPQKGRQRQFNQFGIENIGSKNPMSDVETISMGYNLLKKLGIKNISILINTLGDNKSRQDYRIALEKHFKDSLDTLCEDCKRRYVQNPLRILDCKIDKDKEIVKNAPKLKDYLTNESKQYFDLVLKGLDELNIPYEIDDKLVRGLDYYTHTVFEVVSNHEQSGSQSTVFAGGRYDGLVSYFDGPDLSGVGFAIGMERLLMLMDIENINIVEEDNLDVYIINLDVNNPYALKIAEKCRLNGYKTEMNVIERSMKAQFKSVDRKNSKTVIIVGEDEINNNSVNIKNLQTKQQVSVSFDKIIDTLKEFIGE